MSVPLTEVSCAVIMDGDRVLVTQRSAEVDDPAESDLFEVGTLATVLQLLKLPDGTTKVLVEGGERVSINKFIDENGYFEIALESLEDIIQIRFLGYKTIE